MAHEMAQVGAPAQEKIERVTKAAQVINALTPMIAVVVSFITLAVTVIVQGYQLQEEKRQKVDSDWRAALQKVSLDENSALVGELQMQTFLSDKEYGPQARLIISRLTPKIPQNDGVDMVLTSLGDTGDSQNQAAIIAIGKQLSNSLRDDFQRAIEINPSLKAASFDDFLANPDHFIKDDTDSELLTSALRNASNLESLGKNLSNHLGDPATRVVPAHTDLTGIIFLKHDFSKIDFRAAAMDGALFCAGAKFSRANLPQNVPPDCTP